MSFANTPRKILITNALPYANGPLHIGHMVGFMQADIWARFHKIRGHKVTFVGGDDQHGTPIMLGAEAKGISPQQLIDDTEAQHLESLAGFSIGLENSKSVGTLMCALLNRPTTKKKACFCRIVT